MKYIKPSLKTCKTHIAGKNNKALCGSKMIGELVDEATGKVCTNCLQRLENKGFGRS